MNRYRSKIFFLMFLIVALLNVNYSLLRSVRNTLVVADLGGGANFIPYFELFGTLPGAILMTYGIAKLLSRFSIRRTFMISMAFFLSFFLLFTFGVYPFLASCKEKILLMAWLPGREWLSGHLGAIFALSFYVMAELWKMGLLTLLFWGLVNQHVSWSDAKILYAPLMLAGSIGAIVAGPLIQACSSQLAWDWRPLSNESWAQALTLMMLLLCLVGLVTASLYQLLFKQFKSGEVLEIPKNHFSLIESLKTCLRSRYLLLLGWIVIVDYIAYSLGEIIFLDVLKERFPQPIDYCNWLGNLSLWSGICTAAGALIIAPWMMKHCSWTVAALVTPLCLLATEGAFFLILRSPIGKEWFGWTHLQWLEILIALGSLQYCLCRAAKYTLFDASKELALVALPTTQKMQGKLIIDGIGSRLGRGGASVLSIFFIEISGGMMSSAGLTGIVAMVMTLSWLFATGKLGDLVEERELPVTAS